MLNYNTKTALEFLIFIIVIYFGSQFIPSQLSGMLAAILEERITGQIRFSKDYQSKRLRTLRIANPLGAITATATAFIILLIRRDGIHWWILGVALLSATIVHLPIFYIIYSKEIRQ